jgi:hypothetical protein
MLSTNDYKNQLSSKIYKQLLQSSNTIYNISDYNHEHNQLISTDTNTINKIKMII